MVGYEGNFLRLSRYARGLIANYYEKSIRFEKGLRYDIKVLIAFYKERVFVALVDKEKIVDEVKHIEREKRDREKNQNKNKRDLNPSSSSQRPMKQSKYDKHPQAENKPGMIDLRK